ncbi:hypothetical protein J3R30DRAFT_3444619 [Lentinula aciculospora]|uniref:Uncharacterized protein n=1 Tax=Lentinula aciculospora TaxID=153920 RepID=A0A9W9DU20_9AGAR|nr:hypothetical protein J3R30DRAFT_3444619 [Lentinula aciculospora]
MGMGVLRINLTKAYTLSSYVHLDERGEPKIGGSVGGFIALVVCLILVIIVACTATYFLLREEIYDEENATRRRRRYHHHATSPSAFTYDPSSTPSKSWLASLKGMFSGRMGSARYNATRRMKSRDGWVQANSGDEWDDDMRDVERLRNMRHSDAQYIAYSPTLDPPFRPPGNLTLESASTSTAHLESPPSHRSDYRIPNRFASELAEPPTSSVQSPLEIATLPRSASPESVASPQTPPFIHFGSENRKDSTNSDISTRTFSNGTKFIEGL